MNRIGLVLATALLAGVLPAAAIETVPPPAARAGKPGTDALVAAVSAAWFRAEWHNYVERFVKPEGRVADNGNGGVSHSEGQGYGLLLAAKANDAARFEALWRWTDSHLMVREDGLAAWKWDPATGRVADTNNASDGDILIAWALAEGAARFHRPDYREAGARIARAIGTALVKPHKPGPILLPGAKGFAEGEQPDGPVVNLSYWVFPAFAALKDLAPDTDWDGLRRTGLTLLDQSRFGPHALPTEWESLSGRTPRPARNFTAEFGYNAIRIPLYLALEGSEPARRALRRFSGSWTEVASPAAVVDVKAAAIAPPLGAPGYDLVLALARCSIAGQVIPPEMISARSDLYYPETLRLLSVVALQERFPACL